MKLCEANKSDEQQIINILTEAFISNKSINFVVNKPAGIKRLIRYAFRKTLLHGQAYLLDDGSACALLTFPRNKKFSIASLLLDMHLALFTITIPRIKKILRRENMISMHQPKGAFAHLWFIGTKKKDQGKGKGSFLLKQILQLPTVNKYPVYLETSVPENVKWYQKHGFQIEQVVNTGFDLFIMRRAPGHK